MKTPASLWFFPGFRNLPGKDYCWDIFASFSPFLSSIIYPNSTSCQRRWFIPTCPDLWVSQILQERKISFFNPYSLEASNHGVRGNDVNSALTVCWTLRQAMCSPCVPLRSYEVPEVALLYPRGTEVKRV